VVTVVTAMPAKTSVIGGKVAEPLAGALEICLEAEQPVPHDLDVVTDLGAAEHAVHVLRGGERHKGGVRIVIRRPRPSPAAAEVQADIRTGPLVHHQRRRRRLERQVGRAGCVDRSNADESRCCQKKLVHGCLPVRGVCRQPAAISRYQTGEAIPVILRQHSRKNTYRPPGTIDLGARRRVRDIRRESGARP
jgi:hypothetical protein